MMNVTRAPHTPDARPTVRHVLAGRAARVNVISAIKTRPLCSPLQALVELAKLRNGGNMTPTSRPKENDASANITKRMQELEDWRGETLAQVRRLIHEADPDVLEEWKWVKPTNPGVPVWSHDGGICTGEAYKQAVKLTFAELPSKIRRSSSTPVSKGTCAAPLTFTKERRSMKRRSNNSFAPQWPPTPTHSPFVRPRKSSRGAQWAHVKVLKLAARGLFDDVLTVVRRDLRLFSVIRIC
jgi:hypothetical protein